MGASPGSSRAAAYRGLIRNHWITYWLNFGSVRKVNTVLNVHMTEKDTGLGMI